MESQAKSSNYFGTFLETVKQEPTQGNDTATVPLKLLQMLAERGPQTVPALQTELGLDLITFSKVLETTVEANLVQLSGEAGSEVVSLTEQGRTLASLQSSLA